jgi:hypothetical protein
MFSALFSIDVINTPKVISFGSNLHQKVSALLATLLSKRANFQVDPIDKNPE